MAEPQQEDRLASGVNNSSTAGNVASTACLHLIRRGLLRRPKEQRNVRRPSRGRISTSYPILKGSLAASPNQVETLGFSSSRDSTPRLSLIDQLRKRGNLPVPAQLLQVRKTMCACRATVHSPGWAAVV